MRRANIVILLFLVLGTGVSASELSGYFRQNLGWEFADQSISLASVFNVDVAVIDSIDTAINLSFKDDGFCRGTLSCTWNENAHRLKYKLQFDDDGFDECSLEWRYKEAPWQVEWDPTLEEGQTLVWTLDISYKSGDFDLDLKPVFQNLLSFSSFKSKLKFVPFLGWTAQSTMDIDPFSSDGAVAFALLLKGKTNLGNFSFTVDNMSLSKWSYEWSFSSDEIWSEFNLDWQQDEGIEYEWDSEYWQTERSGYAIDIVAEGTQPVAISSLTCSVFTRDLKIHIDFVEQEIAATIKREMDKSTTWNLYLTLDLDDGEGEIESYWEDDVKSLDIDLTFSNTALGELSIEVELDL